MSTVRRAIAIIGALAAIAATLSPASARTDAPPPEYAQGRVLVRFRDGVTTAARTRALDVVGGRISLSIPNSPWRLVKVRNGLSVPDALRTLRAHEAVDLVEPDYLGHVTALPAPADPCFAGCAPGKQWDIGAVNAAAGWNVFPGTYYTAATKKTMTPVKVAVLDTQIETTLADWSNRNWPADHPESAANGGQLDLADAGFFIDPGAEYGQALYHGSFVAGVLAAGTDNTVGVSGFGYSAQIMPVTVVQGDGVAPASAVAAGINHAVAKGARVINLSLGITADSTAVRNAVSNAASAGVLVVAAAGNAGSAEAFYPAWYTGAMAVTAIGEDDRPGACTNHSFKTSVGAPGVGIVSLDPVSPTGLRKEVCGTSTATPHVSALAALLFAQDPSRTASQVRDIIQRTADDARSDLFPGRDDYYGHGRINFERALSDATPGSPQVTKLLASIPRAQGGTSRATALGQATATTTLTEARWRLDLPTGPATGVVRAADGAFDEQSEGLEADIDVPLSIRAGVYRLFVSARDATGAWGPSAVAALVVDRTQPVVTNINRADGKPWTAAPLPNQQLKFTMKITDDLSSKVSYTYKVWRTIAGIEQVAYTSPVYWVNVPFDGTAAAWVPQPTDIGPYTVTVSVTDEGNNTSVASTQVLAL